MELQKERRIGSHGTGRTLEIACGKTIVIQRGLSMRVVIRNPAASAPPDAANEQQHETKITRQFAAASPEPL
jgi:hypothetical protein